MKLNTGFMTIITIDDKIYTVDGYVKKDVFETVCTHRTMMSLDWTNHQGETELTLLESFIEDKNGNIMTIEIEDIDENEKRIFDSQVLVAEAVEKFIAEC